MRALLIPLDDRPITFTFPSMLAQVAGIEVLAPPRSLMGSLFHPAQIDSLFSWVNSTIDKAQPDVVIVALDSLLYGGLITSRRSDDPIKTISRRLANIKKWKAPGRKQPKIYAQTSVMRISDNYDNTEEKQYWARYGREIFAWSTVLYRMQKGAAVNPGILESYEQQIPEEIREDYLGVRFRNFQMNQEILGLVSDGTIDRLVISVDDTGSQGLNVIEREKLVARARSSRLNGKVYCYPGADEVLSTLMATWLNEKLNEMGMRVRARVQYSPSVASNCQSRYEGQPISQTINSQLEASGVELVQSFDSRGGEPAGTVDVTVVVHGGEVQGDHILLPGLPDLRQLETGAQVKETLSLIEKSTTPCIVCDVAYANGADPILMEELVQRPELISKLIGYAGWNTTGNTVGSALSMGIARLFAIRTQRRNPATDRAFQRCAFTRMADDWAYQSLVRGQLNSEASIDRLAQLIRPYLGQIGHSMQFEPGNLRVSFPWKRTFELEVCFEDP